jgi:predicted permease
VILAEDYEMKPGESLISPMRVAVTPGYFEAMNTPLIRGRYFEEHDNDGAPGVIIVDEKLARRFWGEGNPIGKRMRRPDNPNDLLQVTDKTKWLTVVGVVREVQLEDLAGRENSVGAYYLPYSQMTQRGFAIAIKGADPAAVVKAVRGQLARTDPEIPLFDIRTMSERMDRSLMSRKTAMLLAAVFGCVSLFLSALGIYGVLAYLVAQRTREIGIRVALGSTTSGIFKLVLYEGLLLVGCGLMLGVAGATTLRNTLQNQIYGIRPMDPVIIAIVMGVLGTIALMACVIPAHRATRVDPVSALN